MTIAGRPPGAPTAVKFTSIGLHVCGDPVWGRVTDGVLYVIMQSNPTGIDN